MEKASENYEYYMQFLGARALLDIFRSIFSFIIEFKGRSVNGTIISQDKVMIINNRFVFNRLINFSNCGAIQDIFPVNPPPPKLIPARLECWNILCVDIHYMVLKTKKMVRVFFYNGELNFGPLLCLFSFFIVYLFFLWDCVVKIILLKTFDKLPKGVRNNIKIHVFPLIISFNLKRKCQTPLRKSKMYQKDCYIKRQFTILFELLIPSTKDTNGRYLNIHVI